VVSGTAEKRVGAALAVQGIVTVATVEIVGVPVAGNQVVQRCADDVLDVQQGIGAVEVDDGLNVGGAQIDLDGSRHIAEIRGVHAVAAVQRVAAGATTQMVVPAAADEGVVALAAAQPGPLAEIAVAGGGQSVVAVAAIEPVGHAAIAGDLVVAVTAHDQLN